MNTVEFEKYRDLVLSQHSLQFYLPRVFRTAEEWDRYSTSDFRNVSFEIESEPTLDDLLNQQHLVILGEPGSGKTTVAHAAVQTAFDKGFLPIFAPLRSYDGNLAALLAQAGPANILDDDDCEGKPIERVYILDGFDEVPGPLLDELVADIERVLTNKPRARLVLTSRQAFFRQSEHLFHRHFPGFYILGLRSKDIDAFLQHEGTPQESFRLATDTAGLRDELANPFALGTLSETYRRTGSLGKLRSEAVRNVIDNLLLTRPTHDRLRERRALRMLAVAMETAAHNELTRDQAALALTASLRTERVEADHLLRELCESLLIATPTGYAFGARSHGEYLAAEELSERSLPQIRRLAFTVSQEPIESWRNSLSYLIELHEELRLFMARRHPSWVIRSSPQAFEPTERAAITSRILECLGSQHEFLYRHPLVALDRLALFVEPDNRTALLGALSAPADDATLGNSLLLLGKVNELSITAKCLEVVSKP